MSIKDLSLPERAYLKAYMANGGNQTEAYLSIRPKIKRKSAGHLAAKMMANIKSKSSFEERLEYLNLGDQRIAYEAEKGLQAKTLKEVVKTQVVQIKNKDGKVRDKRTITIRNTVEVEDNVTQARTRELLADFHGKRKIKTESEVPGVIRIAIAELEKPGNTGLSDDKDN